MWKYYVLHLGSLLWDLGSYEEMKDMGLNSRRDLREGHLNC
jgi:hypothetical protein